MFGTVGGSGARSFLGGRRRRESDRLWGTLVYLAVLLRPIADVYGLRRLLVARYLQPLLRRHLFRRAG